MTKYWRFYHVFNRGVRKVPLFLRVEDYEMFVSRLGRYCLELGIQVLAFSLLPNHFHLELGLKVQRMVSSNAGDMLIAKLMHRLATSYGVHYNKLYKTSGHVFQGTYKWKRILTEDYLVFLSRYIHRNPAVLAGSIKGKQRVAYMSEYRWSSYQYYLGLKAAPKWLNVTHILRHFGGYRQRYRIFVEKSVTKFKQAKKYIGAYMAFSR